VRWIDHSSRGVLRTVACRCVWSRNLEKEEAKARHRAVKIHPQWVVTPGKQTTTKKLHKKSKFDLKSSQVLCSKVIIKVRIISFTNFNAQFLYSLTICMLHYYPRHVSNINMPIFKRKNCIHTASGIVTLCKRLYSIPDCSPLSTGVLYSRLQRATIPDAVWIQFFLLKMGMLMLETCRRL